MKCECCRKTIRRNQGATLFSSSATGNSCTTILCLSCAMNNKKREKMQRVNDYKLDKMDEII